MKASLFGALDAALVVITMWIAASIALIALGYSNLGLVFVIGVSFVVGFLAGAAFVGRAPDILKRRKRRRAVDTIFWMLSFSVLYMFGMSLFRPPHSIQVAVVETVLNPLAWVLVVVAAVRNRVGNAQPSSPVVPVADGGRKEGTVEKAEHFADIPGMPFDSLDDLRDAVERREVDLGIAMDYARQWLIGGTGRPLWARVVCELLGMLPLTFGAPLVYLAWRSFGATSLVLLVPVCLSWIMLRPAWLRLHPELLWISWAWLPIALVGAGFRLPWVSWIAVAIGGPCILNGLMYRLASNKARDAALQDEALILAFWNAGGLTVVTTPIASGRPGTPVPGLCDRCGRPLLTGSRFCGDCGTPTGASARGDRWDQDEDQYILEHQHEPARDVALHLGRTLWGVRGRKVRLRKMGLGK